MTWQVFVTVSEWPRPGAQNGIGGNLYQKVVEKESDFRPSLPPE